MQYDFVGNGKIANFAKEFRSYIENGTSYIENGTEKTGVIDFDHFPKNQEPASDWVDAIIRDGKSSLQIKRDEDEAKARAQKTPSSSETTTSQKETGQ